MSFRCFSSVRGRLFGLLTALFAVYLAAILGLYVYLIGHERQQARERALDFARSFAAEYERQFGKARELLDVLAALQLTDGADPAACGELLDGLMRIDPQLLNLAVLDGAGRVRCPAALLGRPLDLAALPAVRKAIDSGTIAAATLQKGPAQGKPAVVIAQPVGTGAGRRIVFASLDLEAMNRRFAASMPPGAVLRILDHEGVFLVRQPDPECCVGRSGLDLVGIRQALAGNGPHLGESRWMDNVVRVQADVPLGSPVRTSGETGAAGVVSVGIPVELVLAPADRALAAGILFLLLLSTVLYALAWLGSNRYLLQPIGLLASAARRLRAGELTSRLRLDETSGEFAELAADFNDMAETLALNRIEIEADRHRLRLAAGVFDHAREAIFITDAESNILAVNRRFTEITGYSADEAKGRNPSLLRSGRHDEAFYRAMWVALATHGHWSGDIWNRRKDGTIYPEWLSITAVRDNAGRIANYVALFTDLSLRRGLEDRLRENEARLRALNEELERRVTERTQALQTANGELEAFSYSVSHDLRAPLRAINGFARLTEEEYAERLDDKGRDYLRRICNGAQKMGTLIEDLLALSRLSRQDMKTGPVNLSALAAGIARELAAGEPDRHVEWSIAPDLKVQGDAGLLAAALENLLGNAWKYSSKRELSRIEFGTTRIDEQTVCYVRDNGAGFDLSYAGKLFAPFQRLHSPAEFPGTGIGLATVARIVQRHGGRIWADSAPEQGATFYFTLAPSGAD